MFQICRNIVFCKRCDKNIAKCYELVLLLNFMKMPASRTSEVCYKVKQSKLEVRYLYIEGTQAYFCARFRHSIYWDS